MHVVQNVHVSTVQRSGSSLAECCGAFAHHVQRVVLGLDIQASHLCLLIADLERHRQSNWLGRQMRVWVVGRYASENHCGRSPIAPNKKAHSFQQRCLLMVTACSTVVQLRCDLFSSQAPLDPRCVCMQDAASPQGERGRAT